MKITLYGLTPSKKNSRINLRNGMSFPSSKYTAWHKDASLQLIGIKPIKSKSIEAIFYAGDNRKFDLSNKFESIADLLVDNGLLEDDNWEYLNDIHLKFGGVDKGNPRCEISYN